MSTISPLVRVFAWDVAEIASPVGGRTMPGGQFAFKYMVASGCMTADPLNPATTSGTLLFEGTKFDLTSLPLPPYLESKPACLTFNLANSGVAISDLKLFLIDDSALRVGVWYGVGSGLVQVKQGGSNWLYNLTMPSGSNPVLTTSIPSLPNVRRQDGTWALAGQSDSDSSEFIYLNLILPLGFPLGSFGVCGSGLLRFGLVFNYWSNDYLLSF
jgi:hypothetical protein